jgi:hypothetical protein
VITDDLNIYVNGSGYLCCRYGRTDESGMRRPSRETEPVYLDKRVKGVIHRPTGQIQRL